MNEIVITQDDIDTLKAYIDDYMDKISFGNTDWNHSYALAIKAMEKQISKEPLKRLCGDCQRDCIDCDRYEDRCPNCNGSLYIEGGKPYKYCPNCGQKLDWSE